MVLKNASPCNALNPLFAKVKVVRHASAKHMRLRVSVNRIRLTVPKNCSESQIQQFLVQSDAWLTQAWQTQSHSITAVSVPSTLSLFNQQESLEVKQSALDTDYLHVGQTLHVNVLRPLASLKVFLLDYARQHLPTYLAEVADSIGLSFSAVQVRWVKTRWGSCNRQHKIMLNVALVLLPKACVYSVCVHELVHTKVFNHSKGFWDMLQHHDALTLNSHQILKQMQWPDWVVTLLSIR